jgi:hypothetical protein
MTATVSNVVALRSGTPRNAPMGSAGSMRSIAGRNDRT